MSIEVNSAWSKTHLGRPIPLFRSSNQDRPVFFIGGVHGDEPEGVELAIQLLKKLKEDPELTPPCGWVLIPCLNVDGFISAKRANGQGVDLNRNYPSQGWSSTARSERYNPGPSPGSEPEIKSLVDLIKTLKPRLLIHFHSWKPCIVATGDPAIPFAEPIAKNSGYELKNEIGYHTPGSLSEYGWHDHKIPVICIEAQERSEIKSVWPRFSIGMIELLKQLQKEPL